MEFEVISKENIKPSTPTPHDLKTHKLSLLDQIVPPIYIPLVLYYPSPEITSGSDSILRTTQTLKQSLSSTLIHFYPLAGRVKDKLSIDCNDEGVPFTVAKFQTTLSEFLKKPDPLATRAHIPSQLTWAEPGPGSNVAMIQLNYFSCGGVAIGALFLHKVVDGVTVGQFMKSWAAKARGLDEILGPDFSAQHLFPHNAVMQRESHLFSVMRRYFKFGRTVMRRYVFDATSIESLRARLPEKGVERRPTRVETVSAFIWRCFMLACARVNEKAAISENGDRSISLLTHNMNVRRKNNPPFSDNSFGNFVWLVPASSDNNDEHDRDLKTLFNKIRNALSKVDVDFVKQMQGEDGFSGYSEIQKETWSEFPENADYLSVSSWCNFGFYGIDFGWGMPAWITKCDAGSDVEWPFVNVLWLTDTRKGDGIEAWLTLDVEYFAEFDKIQDIRDLAKIDPSPLDIHES
ncbi:HXXXD-type acyl-transferase family protein [Striga hermonthica]|uniref:HXXXD-type acyl-transferase family protein n=1 Tax=Striga hermonthica TaxID=68872 RepID=A0A9N7NIK0_STRHE|nr:HXXXD-type acyl-transferase family protein [Striga hermonthica]